jgi:adenine deaminase
MVEKLRLGMWVYGRENTFRHTVGFLVDALQQIPQPWNVALCTDDIDPADLLLHGHMDRGLRVLLGAGVDPALAVRFTTLNGAVRYGLHDLGAIAPGKLADIVLAESFTDFRAKIVLAGGRVVARDGQLVADFADPAPPPLGNTVRIGPVSADTFRLHISGDHPAGEVLLKCIDIDPVRTTSLGEVTVRVVDGECAFPLPDGVTLLSVVPRHGQTHPPTLALLRGLPLRDGALATTVAHDSHNLIVAGRIPEDMAVAVREVARMGGGVALAVGGAVVATVRLPVVGLMSDASVEAIAAEVRAFNARAGALGLGGASPVLAISSLALPVAPFARITDRGVVDTLTQQFIAMGTT